MTHSLEWREIVQSMEKSSSTYKCLRRREFYLKTLRHIFSTALRIEDWSSPSKNPVYGFALTEYFSVIKVHFRVGLNIEWGLNRAA